MEAKNKIPALLSGLLCIGLLLGFCSKSPTQTAGGGSDTEVTGRIVLACGAGKADARVMLIPADYIAAFDTQATKVKITTTGSDGAYRFTRVDTGTYTLQANDPKEGGRLLINNIRVNAAKNTIPPDSLKKPATLVVPLPDSISKLNGYAYVPGTTIYKEVSQGSDAVVFDSVPQCTLKAIQFKTNRLDAASPILSDVMINSPGTIVVHPYSAWPHSANVFINTTASGAGTRSAVTHFPLLIRLNSANFDFSQAQTNGQDIRFAKPIGKALAYEIASWDAATHQAVLWVAVDTVYPNNDTQRVVMFWGNNAVRGESNPAAVFDTAAGFAAVWHLEQEKAGVGSSGLYKDATFTNANGDDWVYSTDQDGIVGSGHGLGDNDKITTNSPVAEMAAGSVTISLWVKLSGPGGVILSKGRGNVVQSTGEKQLFFSNGDPANAGNGLKPSFSGKGSGYAYADTDMPLNEWHYLTFRWSFEFGTASFFIDSVQTGITTTYGAAAPDNPEDKVTIGFNGIQYFNGFCDEIHVSKVSRSSDWIRLSYENQKLDQTTATVGK
jgi:hypothetical protein